MTTEMAVIPADAGLFQPAVDGSVLVDWDALRANLRTKPVQELATIYLDTGKVLEGVMDEINAIAVAKAAELGQTLIPLADGRQVEVKAAWSKYDVTAKRPEAIERLKEAQGLFNAQGVDVVVYQANRRLTLDGEVMAALGLTEQALVPVADAIHTDVYIPDVKQLHKAVKLGGPGGAMVESALTKSEGGKKLKLVNGTDKHRATPERIAEATAPWSREDFDRA